MALTMLVTLDKSEFSEKILATAGRIAAETRAKVILLHVFPPVHDVARSSIATGPGGTVHASAYAGVAPPETSLQQVESATQAAARAQTETLAYLQPLASHFESLTVECVAREGAHPAEEILRTAESQGVDLIAMATHGRTGLAHVLVGSVAAAVVRSGKFPVVLVRPLGA